MVKLTSYKDEFKKPSNLLRMFSFLVIFGFSFSLYAQTTATAYYVAVGGTKTGPYTLVGLKQMAQNGMLTRNTQVWKEGMQKWVKAWEVSEIASLFDSVPRIEYKVAVNGKSTGPFSMDVLREMIQKGTLTKNTHVWKTDMPEWVKAGEVPEIAALFSPGSSAGFAQSISQELANQIAFNGDYYYDEFEWDTTISQFNT
ncbi:hypothetical protein AGMMS4952_23710 [Spirochaetia bacterium]|nr:hypothetical protein AGMMS4952_23710 [Spirochaetia bacterium]